MEKKLAIKGHLTRGKEVIELLEMMGGSNFHKYVGNNDETLYYIDDRNNIDYDWTLWDNNCYTIFTLEEFLEKYPYKVGDKVYTKSNAEGTIIDMFWDGIEVLYQLSSESVNALGHFRTNELKLYKETDDIKSGNSKRERTHEDVIFDSIIWHLRNSVNNGKQNLSGGECEEYFRELVKKNNENKMKNVLAELLDHIKTTPTEGLEREFEEIKEWSNVGPTVEEFMIFCECVNKKPKYPTTYEECIELLYLQDLIVEGRCGYEWRIISNLQKLLLCRDAYWKIYGEEMGLGKPWKPDWTSGKPFYCISVSGNTIVKGKWYADNKILAFPTEEMRDAFYENFKDLIESCKELLKNRHNINIFIYS